MNTSTAPLVKLPDGRVVLRGKENLPPKVRVLRKGESVSLAELARQYGR